MLPTGPSKPRATNNNINPLHNPSCPILRSPCRDGLASHVLLHTFYVLESTGGRRKSCTDHLHENQAHSVPHYLRFSAVCIIISAPHAGGGLMQPIGHGPDLGVSNNTSTMFFLQKPKASTTKKRKKRQPQPPTQFQPSCRVPVSGNRGSALGKKDQERAKTHGLLSY